MTDRTYMRLPINADEGFPQAFRLSFNGRVYQFSLYINVSEEAAASLPGPVWDLPQPGAFMVLRIARESPGTPEVFFRRKLVPDVEYEAAELALVFRTMQVARQNLNGVGAFGSQVVGGIAARWAS